MITILLAISHERFMRSEASSPTLRTDLHRVTVVDGNESSDDILDSSDTKFGRDGLTVSGLYDGSDLSA